MAADPTVQTIWTRDAAAVWFSTFGEVKIYRPADSTAAETQLQPYVQTQTLSFAVA